MSDVGLGLVETGEVLPLRDDPDLKWDQEAFSAGVERDYGKPGPLDPGPEDWDETVADYPELVHAAT